MASIAITVVVVVLLALAAVVVLDVVTGGERAWLTQLRQWQGLIGTMLGFVTAAGILAISASIQDEAEQRRGQQALERVGQAIQSEVKTLDAVLARADAFRGAVLVLGDGVNAETPTTCSGTVLEFNQSVNRPTPLYDAAAPHLVQAGEANLSLYVSFYSLYQQVARDVADYVRLSCPAVLPTTEELIFEVVDEARARAADIAALSL